MPNTTRRYKSAAAVSRAYRAAWAADGATAEFLATWTTRWTTDGTWTIVPR